MGQLKVYFYAAIAAIIGLLGFLLRSEQLKRAKEATQRQKAARAAEHRADVAIKHGLRREEEKVREAVKRARTGDRRHFE